MGRMISNLPLRVLVVDNNEPVCTVTTEILKLLGHHAACETDSQGALKLFSANPDEFDLAIIEPMLPDLTGLDLAISFRHIRPDFPILFYAGHVKESLSHQIDVNGLGPVVSKPCTAVELSAAIENRLSVPLGGESSGGANS